MASPSNKPGFSFPGPVPKEALEFFRAKGLAVGFDHRDVWKEEHSVAFTVAKAMSVAVLESIRGAVDAAIAEGQTPQQFAKQLRPILQDQGWWGIKEITDPKTGEKKEVQLGSPRRLQTIFEANLRTARAAGQWGRIQRNKSTHPYLIYELGPSKHHRDEHESWEGLILPIDDPFWKVAYPPNGWGCKCRVRAVSKSEADERGGPDETPDMPTEEWVNDRTGEVTEIPHGIDPGWDYNPGAGRLRAMIPPPLGGLPTSFPEGVDLPELPPPRPLPASKLMPDGLTEREYVAAFLNELGAGKDPAMITDKAGEPLVVGEALFQDRRGMLKVTKRGRHRDVRLLAQTILDPDEIWSVWSTAPNGAPQLRRRYISRFQVGSDETPVMAVFEWGKDGWKGVTGFSVDAPTKGKKVNYLENQRGGFLAYRRK